jgi:hypothetical protein
MRNHLTKANERVLAASASRSLFWRIVLAVLAVLPIFWLAGAAGDLFVAHRLAAAEGLSFRDLAPAWYSPEPTQAYSGVQLLAVKRAEAAFGKVLLALVFLGVAISTIVEVRRRNRIYRLLRARGLLGSHDADA